MSESNAERPRYDVIIVGAGAAGLLAAIRSAERGRQTLLIEKNRKPGVKILMSGGTRCNLTHDCNERGIIAGFGPAGSFLHSPLAALGTDPLRELFHAEGVATKIEEGGKVFPHSDRAIDVLQALLRRLERSGAKLLTSEPVHAVERGEHGFSVLATHGRYEADKLLITTGGKSYPGCGTRGDGYAWLSSWGHTIRPPRPALVPIMTDEAWVKELSGVTIIDAYVRVEPVPLPEDDKPPRLPQTNCLIDRRGSVLFTHFGLSGPAILDVSRAVTAARRPRDVRLIVDFLPHVSSERLNEQLQHALSTGGKKLAASLLPEELPRRLTDALCLRAGLPGDRRAAECSKHERAQLVTWLKRAPITVTGTRGFDKAEVTAGGVDLAEVHSRTMQSKLVPNLYLAGEILDLDGFIGGYNFQAAFSTGWLAGSHV